MGSQIVGTKMRKRIILLGLMSVLLAGTTGCGLLGGLLYCPLGPGTMCDPGPCVTGCDPMCGPACGPPCAAQCGPDCGTPCGPPCDPVCETSCGGSCCDPVCGPGGGHCRGPLYWIVGLLRAPCWCGPSCGEMYWCDFHGDPPDCCDPCDRYGDYIGRGPRGYAPGMASQAVEVAPAPRVAQPHEAKPE